MPIYLKEFHVHGIATRPTLDTLSGVFLSFRLPAADNFDYAITMNRRVTHLTTEIRSIYHDSLLRPALQVGHVGHAAFHVRGDSGMGELPQLTQPGVFGPLQRPNKPAAGVCMYVQHCRDSSRSRNRYKYHVAGSVSASSITYSRSPGKVRVESQMGSAGGLRDVPDASKVIASGKLRETRAAFLEFGEPADTHYSPRGLDYPLSIRGFRRDFVAVSRHKRPHPGKKELT